MEGGEETDTSRRGGGAEQVTGSEITRRRQGEYMSVYER